MRLSADELAELGRLALAAPGRRAVADQPGGRDQPLSLAALEAARRAALGPGHG